MDCRTARQYLDCLYDGFSDSDDVHTPEERQETVSREALTDHLDRCSACRQLLEEWQHFDRHMYSMLMSSPIPAGLEERLLDAISCELNQPEGPEFAITQAPPARHVRRRSRWTALASLTVLLVLGAVWWSRPRGDELLNYHGAGQLLAERFLNSNAAWEDLDLFDENFDLGTYQNDLGLLQLSVAHGIDLGGGRSQDAAVFEFGLKNWKGIITVLPSQHFTGLPDISSPNVQSGHSVLQWRSSDGKLTYICFVHHGSAAALAQELFGLLT